MNEPYSTIHRLSLNIRITLGRIANHSGERRGREKEEEEEEETEEEKEEDDQAARITHRPTESFARSLATKILIGCAWILHRRPTTREEECIALSALLRARVGG